MDFREVAARTIAGFRASGGRVGRPVLLLHTVGARTALPRVTPVVYLRDADRYLIFASRAGADRHPDWYYNLIACPLVQVEVDGQVLDVRADELRGAERDRWFAEQARLNPQFADYQAKTDRIIPVLALTPASAPAD
jgi:deazaflavin-dependent oxidoreductase (nitroreductase family)